MACPTLAAFAPIGAAPYNDGSSLRDWLAAVRALLLRTADVIDAFSDRCGRLVAWLVPALVVLIGYDVLMRYLFHAGTVALQELEWHLFALIFLLGAAYTLKHDEHVRVDILYHGRRMTARARAWVDLLGGLFFLTPFCLLVIVSAVPYAHTAYLIGETSPDPGGLPYRYVLKAAVPVGFVLLLVQGVAGMVRSAALLLAPRGGES